MQLAMVIGKVISTHKHASYETRKLLYVQPLGLDQKPKGRPTIAIDYVDAGEGDVVLMGAAPGLAEAVFGIPNSPMRELIMGVVDKVSVEGYEPFGLTVPKAKPAREETPAKQRKGKSRRANP